MVRSTRVAPPRVWPLGLGSNDRLALPTQKRWPYQVMTFVEWCGHQQEVALVPDGAEWYAEIPVLGEAR